MSSRGLPGFLRRTRRGGLDESDDDIEDKVGDEGQQSSHDRNDAISPSAALASLIPLGGPTKDSTEVEREKTSTTESPERALGTQNSSLSVADIVIETNTMTDSLNSSFSSQSNVTASKRVSYRETQFSKILGAPVVKLPDLRNLAWNGIPVSFLVTNNFFRTVCSNFLTVSFAPCQIFVHDPSSLG